MNKIKNIIFDAGGVLFESGWDNVKKDIMKKYGFSIFLYSDYPKEVSKKFKGISVGKVSFKDIIKYLNKGKTKNIKFIVKDYKKAYVKHQKINKKIQKLIKNLKKNYNLFCLTDTNDMHLEINLENGLFSDFKKVYASCETGVKKPYKKAFKVVIKDAKIKPEETIFIDDTKKNIDSAKKLKFNTILFKNNNQLIKDLNRQGIK
jgi:putative hydrolase of the HAD superfamily